MSDVTRLLEAIHHGDPKAAEELLPLVYEELRKLAAHKMSHEAAGHTLHLTANQQTGCMKTTIELPGDLVREIKLRALHDGRKLKDAMADLLRQGLTARSPRGTRASRVKLPLVQCRRAAALSPEQVAGALLKQEAAWHHGAS